jgi:hypothetical protein
MNKTCETRRHISWKKTIIFSALSVSFAAIIGEIIIRSINLPFVDRDTHYTIDPVMGYTDIPGAKVFYRLKDGQFVVRRFNSFGYLDGEHKREKMPGTYRIGFFGDSYVEARQVPLKNTFLGLLKKSSYRTRLSALR